jgi:UDP-glucose 4-epimerase
VAIFTGQMLRGEQALINGDGEQQRDFVYVGDCARANLLALQTKNSAAIYNLGSGQGTSVNQIFAALKEITAYALPEMHGPAKVGETSRIYLDAAKARQELEWVPAVSLEEGLGQTVEYFKRAELLK